MTDLSRAVWRKAARSTANGGDCVEVAGLPGRVLVRDSTDPAGPVLSVPAADWRAFVRSLGR
jgi:hypothetical protein